MNLRYKEIVKELGLSDNEAEVYVLLLELNEALASEIAEKSKISRPHIYDTIAKLIDKGLASYVNKNNRRYFKAASPDVLLELLKAKESSLQEVLPELKKLYAPQKEKPLVEVYEGKEGLKNILHDLLRSNKDFCAFGPTTKWREEIPLEMDRYFKQRDKLSFKARLLAPSGTKTMEYKKNEYRFLPKEYSSPATTIMYDDKTWMILWLPTIISILVENKELAESFKSFFEMMWNDDTRVWRGADGLKMYFDTIAKDKPKELMIMGNHGRAADVIPEHWNEFNKKRYEIGLRSRRIYDDTPEARKAAGKHPIGDIHQIRFNPAIGDSPIITSIYHDKVWFMSWDPKMPLVILVKNKDLAEGYKYRFEELWNQKNKTYNGLEGLKTVLEQLMEDKPEEFHIYGSSGAFVKLAPEYINDYHERRIKNRITMNIIYTDTEDSRKRAALFRKKPYTNIRYLPGQYESPIATLTYNNKVVLMAIEENGFAVVVDDPKMADIFKKQFETLWNVSKEN